MLTLSGSQWNIGMIAPHSPEYDAGNGLQCDGFGARI